MKKRQASLFKGSYLTRFALQIGNKIDNVYIMEGINLNQEELYTFTLLKEEDISKINILSNFLPGTLINIISIELINKDFNKILIPLKDIYFSSNNSFFLEDQRIVKVINTSFEDEKIKIDFLKNYKNINEIRIKINFSKSNLTNKFKC